MPNIYQIFQFVAGPIGLSMIFTAIILSGTTSMWLEDIRRYEFAAMRGIAIAISPFLLLTTSTLVFDPGSSGSTWLTEVVNDWLSHMGTSLIFGGIVACSPHFESIRSWIKQR